MSDPRESNDGDEEMQDLSASDEEHEQTDDEVEDEEFPSVMGDQVEMKDSHFDEEGNLGNNGSGVVEAIIVANPSDNIASGDAGIPSESQEGAETPCSVNPAANESKQNGAAIKKTTEKENKLEKDLSEDANKSEETDAKEVHAEENRSDESLKKEEKADRDFTERAEGAVDSPNFDPFLEGDGDGTEEEQAAFMRELENFHKEKCLEFKPPKFYGEGLNCLKLWRAVTRLGGYDQVTSCKLWRQVGESFKPPKTCTTISWSFRCFYEKALLEYEKHKVRTGELRVPISTFPDRMAVESQVGGNQASGSGRARRDAAARAMQGWHSQRLLGNGEVGDPIIKDKTSVALLKRDKPQKNFGTLKRKKPSSLDHAAKLDRTKVKPQVEAVVVDVEHPADWVKINVKRTKDCFEVYALVPGLLREEVHVQSDPAGRLIISGEPEQPDNPWGVTPFKKVVTLPSRIDPHQTSAVVTLHGQLFVRAPFEQSDL